MSSEPVDKGEYLPEELNEMEFKDALFNDHRSFFQYYFSILSEKQIILSTIKQIYLLSIKSPSYPSFLHNDLLFLS